MKNSEDRIQNSEFRIQNSESRRQNSEFRRQNSEFRRQNSEFRRQNSEFRRQNSEFRRQNSEFRRQNSEDRIQNGEPTILNSEFSILNSQFPILHSPFSFHSSFLRGVTLLEITVVLVILGLFFAVSIPVMRGTHRRNQLAAAAREFVVLVRYARQQAILRGRTVEIEIELPNNKYRLVLDPTPDRSRVRSSAREKRSTMEEDRYLDEARSRIYFKSFACATDPLSRDKSAKIRFRRDGSASPTLLVIADVGKREMTVEISGASGSVRAYEGPPEAVPEIPVEMPSESGGTP